MSTLFESIRRVLTWAVSWCMDDTKQAVPTRAVLMGTNGNHPYKEPSVVNIASAEHDCKRNLHAASQFIPVPIAILRHVKASDALVLGGLMSYAGKDGACFPHIDTLTEACGLKSTRTVKYAIERLRELGLIGTARRSQRHGFDFHFTWHPFWKECLKSQVSVKLTDGEKFNPYKKLSCVRIPKPVAKNAELSITARLFLGYMLSRAGENGAAWPSYTEIARDLHIGCRNTISRTLRELEDRGLILTTRRSSSATPNSYTLLLHKPANDCNATESCEKQCTDDTGMIHDENWYHPCTSLVSSMHHLNTSNETVCEKKGIGRLSSPSSPSSHDHGLDAGAETAVVVIEDKKEAVRIFIDSLPSSPAKEKLEQWLGQITTNVSPVAKLKMALQVVMTKGIVNKVAYLNKLILRYKSGEYNVDGIEIMQKEFTRRCVSEHAQYYVRDVVEL